MFWENFYHLCLKRGVTPSYVVKSLGISAGTVTAWKKGVIPATDKLEKISKYFNVQIDELLGKKSSPYQFNNEFVQLFQRLESYEQQAVIDLMKGLLNK